VPVVVRSSLGSWNSTSTLSAVMWMSRVNSNRAVSLTRLDPVGALLARLDKGCACVLGYTSQQTDSTSSRDTHGTSRLPETDQLVLRGMRKACATHATVSPALWYPPLRGIVQIERLEGGRLEDRGECGGGVGGGGRGEGRGAERRGGVRLELGRHGECLCSIYDLCMMWKTR
jgi:hypothetical protein